jgi:hypothetical protein
MSPEERIEQIGEQLRAKITSKFTASTFLAGFALTVLTGQVFTLHQDAKNLSPLYPVSVGAVVAALYLFIYAIIKLDELTMPKRFWEQEPQAQSQPPPYGAFLHDDDLLGLQRRMIFFWQRLTMVATITTAIAVMGMLVPATLLGCSDFPGISTIQKCTFFAALAGVVTAFIYCWCIATRARKLFGPLYISD